MCHNKYITSPKFFCTLYLIYFFCLQTNPQMTTKNGIIYMSSPLKFSDFVSFGFLLSLVNKPPKLLQKMDLLYIISLSLKSWHSFCLWFSSFAHKQNPKILQAWHSKNVYSLFGPSYEALFFRAFRRWPSGAVSLSCKVNWRWRTRSGWESTVGTLWNKPW